MTRKFTFTILAMLFAILGPGAEAWGQKITTLAGITSGNNYYIGATTSSTDYYFSANGSSTSTSIAGTAVSAKSDATVLKFTAVTGGWTIQFESGNYLGLKNGKDNGKVQVVEVPVVWTIEEDADKGLLKLHPNDYYLQKNNSSAPFGSYKNTQTDVWLEAAGSTPSAELESIAISGTPTKTTYEAGESFDPAGLVVTGTYDDESTAEITSGITWNVTPNPLTAGTTSVSVTAMVDEIESEPFEVTGLTVNEFVQTYANTYTSDASLSSIITGSKVKWEGCKEPNGYNALKIAKAGTATITVPAGTKTVHLHMVAWNGESAAVTVKLGSTTLTSITPTADAGVSGSGTTYTIATEPKTENSYYFAIEVNTDKAATLSLTTASNKRAILFGVNFEAASTKTLTSIAIKTPPTKTTYNVGDNFNPAGLVITATYDDASTEDIAYEGNEDKFSFEPSTSTTLTTANTSVTITYGGKTTTQAIIVSKIKLATPTNLEATNIASTSATLTWDEVENASSYEVNIDNKTLTAETNSLLVENLTASTTYTWTVKAIGNETTYDDSEASAESNFTTLAPPSVAYTVTFNGNEHGTPASGSLTENPAGSGVTLPDCTPNAGYQFVGWATSETATEAEYEAGAIYYPTANIILYAVYNEVYTINYMVNGENTGAQVNVEEGTPLVFPTVTAPDADHVFCGWVTEAIEGTTDTEPAYVNTTDLTATQNNTYYAVFAEKSGSEPAEQKTQTLQYDTWTFYGSTTDKDTYRLFHSGSYIESAEFDLSKLTKVIVYGGTFGGGSYNSLTIGDGTNTWKSVTVSGSSQTGTNTYTDGTPLSGTGKLRITSNSGTATGSGVRISKVEIFTMEGGYTYSNFCTTIETKTLTSISLSGEYPTEFWKGETFSHEGMIVTALYDDESTKDVTASATFTGYDMAATGEQTVTVTYEGKTATYSITVKNIANTQETAYTVDEAKSLIDANPAGLATTEVYVKGTISQVDSYNSTYHSITYWISEDGTTTNQFEVYSGKNLNNTNFASKDDVTVGDDVVVYGIIKKFNSTYEFDKNNYLVSHVKTATLSIDNITVSLGGEITPEITSNVPEAGRTITYSVTSENVVKVDEEGKLVTVAVGGPVTVTATLTAEGYKNATTTFDVEVIPVLTSIAVKTAPKTISYKAGDKFDPTGLVITANYNDESTEDVAYAGNEDKFTFAPSLETPLSEGNTSVTITYAGKETTQEITVRALYTYDITWQANGEEFTTTQVTEGDALVLPGTSPANIGDMKFMGWTDEENYYDASEAPEYIVPSDIIPTEAMTFYAVYAKEHKDIQETTSTMDFSEETYSDWEIDDKIVRTANQGTGGTGDFAGRINTNNTYITFNKKVKVESFGFSFKRTSPNENYNVYIETSTDDENWTAHQTYSMSDFGNGSYTTKTDDTFDGETDLYVRFHCYNTTATRYVDDVIIKYMGEDIAYSNFCTTVKTLSGDLSAATTVANTVYYINGESYVPANAIVTINGALTNTNPANLIIEDGAQLILNEKNIGVMATVKKQIEASNTHTDEPVDRWYTIGSPVKEPIINGSTGNYVADIIPAGGMSALTYDLYYLDMTAGTWINYRQEGGTPGFTTLENGRGYIYSNQFATTVKYVGELNTANVNRSVNTGWNLVSNPFAQTIAFSNFELDNSVSMVGYYSLDGAGGWQPEPITTVVASNTGILVNVPEGASSIEISKPAKAIENNGAKRGDSNDNAYAYIEINVANANYSDRAYAAFAEGYGLPKYDHINAEIQKVYIPQDGEDFAIAMMDENVTLFPVSFKAMTTGYYTISLKSSQIYEGYNDFDYLHLIDNMTGEEIDMLMEDGYEFVGSPRDNAGRFTVKLHRNGIEENDIENINFVYQNGNELVINGEGTFQLIDMLGRVVISKEVHGETVNVGSLNTGAYIVRMIGNEVKTQKIVIK